MPRFVIAFRAAIFMFVASIMAIVAICIVLTPLPPTTRDKGYREVKRVSQQLIFSLEVEVRTGRPLVSRKK